MKYNKEAELGRVQKLAKVQALCEILREGPRPAAHRCRTARPGVLSTLRCSEIRQHQGRSAQARGQPLRRHRVPPGFGGESGPEVQVGGQSPVSALPSYIVDMLTSFGTRCVR